MSGPYGPARIASVRRGAVLLAIAVVGVFAGAQLNGPAAVAPARAEVSLASLGLLVHDAPTAPPLSGASARAAAGDPGVAALVKRLRQAVPRFQSAYARVSAGLSAAPIPPAKPTLMISALSALRADVKTLRAKVAATPVASALARHARAAALTTLTLSAQGIGLYLTALNAPYAVSSAALAMSATAILTRSQATANEAMTLIACRNPCYRVL